MSSDFKMNFLLICTLLIFDITYASDKSPEQVHLSYGALPSQMIVTWTTHHPTRISMVLYGISGLYSEAVGSITRFVDGGEMQRVIYIHRVILNDLIPDKTYYYICGTPKYWSLDHNFHTQSLGDWSPRLLVFGDMGIENAQSLNRMIQDVENGFYDASIHVGDMAYDMYKENGKFGDIFMEMIEPIAANIPYMAVVGNHEQAYNFSHYVNRFTMMNLDGEINNFFYSFNLGSAHIIAFSTEFYFFTQYGTHQILNQLRWLERDLKIANLPKNRAKRPWIITLGHRPMYCSTLDDDDCTHLQSRIRYSLEDLFYYFGVDLEIWAHEHIYERMFPVYNKKMYNGSYANPYVNPGAPIHIITGSAGCWEKTDDFIQKPHEWSAFRSSDYGYTRLNIINRTHLYMEQVSDDQDGNIIDTMLVIKNNRFRT